MEPRGQVGLAEGRVPEARGVRPALGPLGARQGLGRRAVPEGVEAGGARRRGRAPFREEGREHVAARGGQAKPRAQQGVDRCRRAPRGVRGGGAPMGRQGRLARAARSRPGPAVEGTLSRIADHCGYPATPCRRTPGGISGAVLHARGGASPHVRAPLPARMERLDFHSSEDTMKKLALAAGVLFATVAATASAQVYYERTYTYDPY